MAYVFTSVPLVYDISCCVSVCLHPLQELRAQPQEPRPGVPTQEEEAAAHLHLHYSPTPRQEVSVIPADQIQRHGDHRLLHSRSGRQSERPRLSQASAAYLVFSHIFFLLLLQLPHKGNLTSDTP